MLALTITEYTNAFPELLIRGIFDQSYDCSYFCPYLARRSRS